MGGKIFLNNDWLFSSEFEENMVKENYKDEHMECVRLPHTCKETPFNYFDEGIYQMVSCYRRKLNVPKEWSGERVLITLEGVAHVSELYVNGEKVSEHGCGYTAYKTDITNKLKYGEENVIVVKVDSRESNNIPPFGYVVDYMTYGGIYRDVYIDVKNHTHISDIFITSEIYNKDAVLKSHISLNHNGRNLSVRQYIRSKSDKSDKEYELLGEKFIESVVEKKAAENIVTDWNVSDVKLWDIDNPSLYEIKTELRQGDKVIDENVTVFGFREAVFKADGFYLNGKKVKICGLNRHQSYPYVGYAMPKSMQELDADILKHELGLNAVRTSHYPQSHYFINRCDELGLLVFTELPGWQYIGDNQWKEQAIKNVEDMVKQYRNHASIVLWGVRINESADDDEFYTKTNEVARRLDPTRQTGGVRCHKHSSLLEDVYTYNDFSHDGNAPGCESKKSITSDMEKAYLISEYNGHMYPTKSYDSEEHRVEHALRHANVLNAVAGMEDIAGSFGWCMADYNTHLDFGSGDRICYHGVLDMFRNSKMAAYIYTCQQEGKVHLTITSTMDIGEHPGCNRGRTFIITNADSVKMYKNSHFIKEYKCSAKEYSNLKHGPILIDDFIGDAIKENENFKDKQAEAVKEALNLTAVNGLSNLPKKVYFIALKMMLIYHMKPAEAVRLYNKYIGDWGGSARTYRFEAIKDGKVVKVVTKAVMRRVHLAVESSTRELNEGNTYDVAALRIRAKDEYDNDMPFYQEPVFIEVKGPVEIIGEPVISLKGGMGGTYIKTLGGEGEAIVKIGNNQTGYEEIKFTVRKGV